MDGRSGPEWQSSNSSKAGGLALPERWTEFDWSAIACGWPNEWPTALTNAVGLMLRSGFPMFVVWGDERTLLYNDAYIPILGERHPDAFGRPFFSVWPEVNSVIAPVIEAAYNGEASFFENLEVGLKRSDELASAWFTFSYSPILDEQGHVPGALCVCVETTSSVEAHRNAKRELVHRLTVETQLRDLNETLENRVAAALAERRLLAEIVEATDAFVQVLDLDYKWLAINKAAREEFERVFGLRPQVGVSMLELLKDKPADRADVAQVWSRAMAGEAFTETRQFGDPSRDRRFYEMNFNILRDSDGAQIGAYQFVYDVTERMLEQTRRREAEVAKDEADELHRAYFQNAPEALFVIGVALDGGFFVEQLNPAHEASVGFKLDEVRGKRIEEFMPPALLAQVRETYERVLRTGEMLQYRELFEINGEHQHWDTSIVPVRNAEGRIIRLTGASRNATAQIVAEETLRQAQKMDAVGQLTGGIAHDFNNLLGAVMGGFDLILRKPDDAERVHRLATHGLAAAERGARLTGQLLAFSRAQKIERKIVAVAKVVDDMRELLQRTLGPQIVLRFRHEDVATPVLSDRVQLEMAILNLAINARDAMGEGGSLTIATRVRDIAADPELKTGQYVELAVTDTGAGMAQDVIARAFEPFFTTKGVGKGTGLGLSQVYSVARQGAGTARIESSLGGGTTVSMLMAVAAGLEGTETSKPARLRPAEPTGAKILVIDDDQDVRRMLTESLDAIGFRVAQAADGRSGLTVLESEVPDLVIVDFAMPEMNGAEVANVIRAKHPDLPIIIASGFNDTAAIESVAGPPLPVLRKPFRIDDLHVLLIEHLRRGPQ